MRKPSVLSTAISGILFGASAIPAGVALAQDGDDVEQIEEIITTGSRIIRTDKFDTAGHVVAIDEVAIDSLAELNIADVLRSSPLNAYGSFNERSGSSAQSNATFDLRGLGSQRTLVLMDGMRMPGSPNLGADSLNINMLPMVAIQRIDILADGASAVYGSDAVAGVVNLVTHKSFDGIEVSMRYGDRAEDDGGDMSIGILAGASNDRANVVFALEYSKRDAVMDADRWYTAPWIVDDGDGEIHAYSDTDGISYLPMLKGTVNFEAHEHIVYACFNGPAIVRNDGYKLRVYMEPESQRSTRNTNLTHGEGTHYQLYDLKIDFEERKDLAKEKPEILDALKKHLLQACDGNLNNGTPQAHLAIPMMRPLTWDQITDNQI